MLYKHFRVNVVVRVSIIIVLSVALAFVILEKQMLFVPVVIGICLLLVTINLIHYINKSSKYLTHLLLSVREGSFTDTFTSGQQGKEYNNLTEALNEVTQEFARVTMEKELHYQYLQALNENIGVAILSFDEGGKLMMMNPAAKRLLRVPMVLSIEDLQRIDTRLYSTITRMTATDREVIKVVLGEELIHLSIQVKEVVLSKKHVRIFLLQNINKELEEKEIEAWQQLTSVLTHEIMNSVTPIVSLTDAIHSIIKNTDGSEKDLSTLSRDNVEDIHSSITTIGSRSKGLMRFVNSYKEFNKIPEIKPVETDVIGLVSKVVSLLTPDLQQNRIQHSIISPGTSLQVKADTDLIEQVLINIVKNAIEAVPHDGTGIISITIKHKLHDIVSISVSDNGPGMDNETLSRVFIPFFTTKPKGTGIGLSLSRQIMKLHRGTIRVQSAPGHGSIFTIEWS